MRGTGIGRKAIGLAALAMAAGFLPARGSVILTWDSGGASPLNPADGGGTWDAATTQDWSNGSSDSIWNSAAVAAIGNVNGAAGTITLGSAVTAGGINFNAAGSGNYTIAGSNALTLGGTNVTLASGVAPIISAPIAGSSAITVTGTGQLTLSGNNTFSGGINITGGATVNFNSESSGSDQLGATGKTITLNGGTLAYTGTGNANGGTGFDTTSIGTGGGTINLTQSAGGGGGSKLGVATSALTGSGALTIEGLGIYTIAGAETGFTGSWNINGGYVETNPATGLGASGVVVNINSGGELATKAALTTYPINLNGGTIGADGTAGSFAGSNAINVQSSSSIRLGYFYTTTNANLTIAAPITGSGNLALSNGLNWSSATPVQIAASGNFLTLTGNNAGYTGTLTIDGGHGVQFAAAGTVSTTTNASLVASIAVTSSTTAMPLLAIGSNTAPPTINYSGATTGVFSPINSAYTQALDLSALYGGGWFLGADTNNTSFWSNPGQLIPGVDGSGNRLYRLGGGGGSIFIGNAVVTDYTDPSSVVHSASVQIGAPMINGSGTVRYGTTMTYTGSTLIADGTLQDALSSNAIPTGTTITFGSVNSASGTQYAGTLDLDGFNQTVAGLAVASGITGTNIAAQTIGDSSTTAASTLTVNATLASTFGGTIKDKLGSGTKTMALAVLGSGSLDLTNANTYSGGTTVGGTLLVDNTTGSATGIGPVSISSGGILGGDGIITGLVTLGGTLSPGHSPGTITLAGGLTLVDGSILQMDLGTAASDKILITGGTITGSDPGDVTVNINNAGGLSYGQTYTLMDWTGATPSNMNVGDFVLGSSPWPGMFNIVGNQLQLTLAPEPASLSLLVCGAFGLSRRRRRRNFAKRNGDHEGTKKNTR